MKTIIQSARYIILVGLVVSILGSCDSIGEDPLPSQLGQTDLVEVDSTDVGPVVIGNGGSGPADESVSFTVEISVEIDIPDGTSGIMSPKVILGDLYDESLVVLENPDGGTAELLLDKKYLKYTPPVLPDSPPATNVSNGTILLATRPGTVDADTILVRIIERENCDFGGIQDTLTLKVGGSIILDVWDNDEICSIESGGFVGKLEIVSGFTQSDFDGEVVKWIHNSEEFVPDLEINLPEDFKTGRYEFIYNYCRIDGGASSDDLPEKASQMCRSFALALVSIDVIE